MKTNKLLIVHILLLLLSLMHISAYAQKEERKEMINKNDQVETDITSIAKVIDSLEAVKDKRQSRSNAISDSINLVTTEIARIDSLVKSKPQLSSSVDTLEAQKKSSYSILWSKKRLLEQRKGVLEESKTTLGRMAVYERIRVEKIYKQNWSILAKCYSKITKEEIAQISQTMAQFKDCEKFDEYKMRVGAAIKNRQLYIAADSILRVKYDAQIIEKVRNELYPLLFEIKSDNVAAGKFKLSAPQHGELDTLDIKLSRYKNGVSALASIVTRINTDAAIVAFRAQKEKEKCLERILAIVNPEKDGETKRLYDRYFKHIPYLKGLFDAYIEELKANPLNAGGDIEKQIKTM